MTGHFEQGRWVDDRTSNGVDPTIGGIKNPKQKLERLKKQYDILHSHLDELHDKIRLVELDIAKTSCEISSTTPTVSEVVIMKIKFDPEKDWPRKL